MSEPIAVVGAGLIGRAWSMVFARAGRSVRLYDAQPEALAGAKQAIRQSLHDLQRAGLVEEPEAILARIEIEPDLALAVAGAGYVQECGPENLKVKQEIYSRLEAATAPDTILASSTSGIAASRFTGHLAHPQRCLVAHPVNPPYLVPVVEVVPAPNTAQDAVDRTLALMSEVGQVPVLVRRELPGFVLNRLQGALLNEALRLFRDGYVSAEDLDKTVKHGLGLRWSFMGPFETIDLNAPAGVTDYARRYGPLYADVDAQRDGASPWQEETVAALEAERRSALPLEGLAERQAWRDRQLMALDAYRKSLDEL